jgi:hypothetical protein
MAKLIELESAVRVTGLKRVRKSNRKPAAQCNASLKATLKALQDGSLSLEQAEAVLNHAAGSGRSVGRPVGTRKKRNPVRAAIARFQDLLALDTLTDEQAQELVELGNVLGDKLSGVGVKGKRTLYDDPDEYVTRIAKSKRYGIKVRQEMIDRDVMAGYRAVKSMRRTGEHFDGRRRLIRRFGAIRRAELARGLPRDRSMVSTAPEVTPPVRPNPAPVLPVSLPRTLEHNGVLPAGVYESF